MNHSSRSLSYALAICGIVFMPMLLPNMAYAASALSQIDTDKDKTIDLAEAKTSASQLFDRLDKDKEGTLDIKELKGRLSKKDIAAGDPDRDRTLSKDEYLAIVEKAFKAADANGDGTVDAKELKTEAGHALMHLLK